MPILTSLHCQERPLNFFFAYMRCALVLNMIDIIYGESNRRWQIKRIIRLSCISIMIISFVNVLRYVIMSGAPGLLNYIHFWRPRKVWWTDMILIFLQFENIYFKLFLTFIYLQIPETEGASIAASHGVGFCEVSVAENSPNLYKVFEKLLIESRARPVKPRKFSVSKMIGKVSQLEL